MADDAKIEIMGWAQVRRTLLRFSKDCQTNRAADLQSLKNIIKHYDDDPNLTNKQKLEGCESALIELFYEITDSSRLGVHTGISSRLAIGLYQNLQKCFYSITTKKVNLQFSVKHTPTYVPNPRVSGLNMFIRLRAISRHYVAVETQAYAFDKSAVEQAKEEVYANEDKGSAFSQAAMTMFAVGARITDASAVANFGHDGIFEPNLVNVIAGF